MYELDPSEETIRTFEPEPTTGGRRYPFRERRAPTTYANQYILLTDEGELGCNDEGSQSVMMKPLPTSTKRNG